MNLIDFAVLAILAFAIDAQAGVAKPEWDATYCIPIPKVDFNPYREIKDGKDLSYLLLLKSFISTDPSEPGILDAYEFSPDGKQLTGRMAAGLTWGDGSAVTPGDLARSIVLALPFRALGKRVQVVGGLAGIEILDDRRFRIKLESKVLNLTGVLREALSTNSRQNRFWAVKIGPATSSAGVQVLARFPQVAASGKTVLNVMGTRVLIDGIDRCNRPDFTLYTEAVPSGGQDYLVRQSPVQAALTIQPNTLKLDRDERDRLIRWCRLAFASPPGLRGMSVVDRFFLSGESGFLAARKWPTGVEAGKMRTRRWKIGFEAPLMKTVLESRAQLDDLKLDLIALPTDERGMDAQVLVSTMQGGRHVVLQDLLEWPHVLDLMGGAPLTVQSLKAIADQSASTVPIDAQTLAVFEERAMAEGSLAPLARKASVAYSKKSRPFCLNWTSRGELTFTEKKFCAATE